MSQDLLTQLAEYGTYCDERQGSVSADDVIDTIVPLPMPTHSTTPRRSWLVAVAAAALILIIIGGLTWLTPFSDTIPPSDTQTTIPQTTVPETTVPTTPDTTVPELTEPLSSSVWSVVSHDEAVFGGEGSQTILSVTHGGSGLVAVGSDGGGGPWANNSDTDAAVWTSPDGITWSRVPHEEAVFGGARSQVMRSVVAGGPGLVAVGWDGQGILDDSSDVDAAIWTSVDGDTWSRVPHDEEVFGGAWIQSVTVGGPGLVAVGTEGPWSVGDAAVWTSADGINWSRVPHDESVFGGADLQTINDVTMGGPGLVAVGSDGGRGPWDNNAAATAAVWTSVDGMTWFRVPHNETVFGTEGNPLPMLSVTAGGPGLVAVGADLRRPGLAKTPVWTSPDGITWTRVPDDVTFRGAMMDVTVGGPGLVTVGLDGIVWTSVDGITWTSFPDDDAVFGRAGQMFSVITQGPYLVAVGSDGSGTVPDRDAVVWVATLED